MKCLCVAGVGSIPQQFYSLLIQAGMAPAAPAGHPPVDINSWHRQVLEALNCGPLPRGETTLTNSSSVGPEWESLAREILEANSSVPFWGWVTEPNKTLLDFWRGFAPDTHFLLLFINVELYLASFFENHGSKVTPEDQLSAWCTQTRDLLDFWRADPSRCVMLEADEALRFPSEAITRIADIWIVNGLDGMKVAGSCWSVNSAARLLAKNMLRQLPEAMELQHEVSRAFSATNKSSADCCERLSAQALMTEYKGLLNCSAERANSGGEKHYASVERSHLEDQGEQQGISKYMGDGMRPVEERLTALEARYMHRIADLEQELQALRTNNSKLLKSIEFLEDRLNCSVEENELLLMHLHQVQEELSNVVSQQKLIENANEEQQKRLEAQLAEAHRNVELNIAEVESGRQSARRLESRVAQLTQQLALLERRLVESTEENELLLLQLHQAQEELEMASLQNCQQQQRHTEELGEVKRLVETLSSEAESYKAKLQVSERERGELAKQVQERTAREQSLIKKLREKEQLVAELGKANQAHQNLLTEATQKAAILELQKAKFEEDLKRLSNVDSLNKELEKERATLVKRINEQTSAIAGLNSKERDLIEKLRNSEKQIVELVASRQAQQKLLESAKETIATLELQNRQFVAELKSMSDSNHRNIAALQSAETALKVSTEERELTLLHLHQAQEELEQYLQLQQQTEKRLLDVESRLRKMQERYPDYVECASVEIHSASVSKVDWTLRELTLVGREFKELHFSTVLEHGMAGFMFSSKHQASSIFFTSWPVSAEDADGIITLLPLGTPEQVRQRSTALLSLGTSEWSRLLSLTKFLISLLQERASMPDVSNSMDVPAWLEAFHALHSDLSQFPTIPRFDRLRLKRQQINPDYEHLWLSFENFSLGNQRVPQFEFRVSCANVAPGSFGKFPKLEFPRGEGSAIFDSWFVESVDDFGEKLELRFALPDAIDLGVWNKLSARDQETMRKLIKFLPDFLNSLEQSECAISRPWQDWRTMALNIQHIAGRHVSAPKMDASSRIAHQQVNLDRNNRRNTASLGNMPNQSQVPALPPKTRVSRKLQMETSALLTVTGTQKSNKSN